MNKFFTLILNNNKDLVNIIKKINEVKSAYVSLNNKDLLVKINAEALINTNYEIVQSLICNDEYHIVKKKTKNIKTIFIKKDNVKTIKLNINNKNFFEIHSIVFYREIKKKEVKMSYEVNKDYIWITHLKSYKSRKNKPEAFEYVNINIDNEYMIFIDSNKKENSLITLFRDEKINKNIEDVKSIINLILLDKTIDNKDKDLMLLNYDIELKNYKNDFSIFNILENKIQI